MAVEMAEAAAYVPTSPGRKNGRFRRWVLYGISFTVLLIGVVIALLAINWPFKQQALIDVLQERSVRSVTVGSFRSTYFPPGCIAEKISFLHRKYKEKPPLITIEKLVVRGSYWGLISPHKHLPQVRVYGMHVTVPPSHHDGKPNPIMPLTHGASGGSVAIGSIVADGAILDFVQSSAGKAPVRLTIRSLLLGNVGNDLPLTYRALIDNGTPPATIESAGQFGTWDVDDPANTPVHGWYRLSKMNLGVYRIIRGMLRSNGMFGGKLGALAVKGRVDVPEFQVTDTAHSRDLRAEVDATVSVTDGNVDLRNTMVHFDGTTLLVNGSVRGESKEPGKAVLLNIHSVTAHIDDLLKLVISDRQSPMTGDAFVDAQVAVPQGAKSFLREMQVNGSFRIAPGHFTSREIEQDLARISNSAARKDRLAQHSPAELSCGLRGSVAVHNGIAELTQARLTTPGTAASLNGTYNLLNYFLNLHGTLQTDGSPSAVTTGFKSLLMKGLTPMLKKQDGRRLVPFKIDGKYSDAKVELDLGH